MTAFASSAPALIALDWGTTLLRAWLLDARGEVLAAARKPLGVMQVENGDFASVFDAITAGWPDLPALAAGMVGSRQGWVEAPYLACPTGLGELACALVPAPGRRLWIVPGVLRTGGDPDVMRGEETKIVGALALRPELNGRARLVLPSTHSKWAEVSGGTDRDLRHYMTGELFAVLRDHSILGRLVAQAGTEAGGEDAFLRGVDVARAGIGIASRLFSARAAVLTGDLSAANSLDYLSGLLIGDELRSALAGSDAVPLLIGEPALCARYALALTRFGLSNAARVNDAAVAGLWRITAAAGLVANVTPEAA